jgi:uracil-DNA glycosylase family 4
VSTLAIPDAEVEFVSTPVRNPSCKLCQLHETAHSVCIPRRRAFLGPNQLGGRSPTALLVIGEAPGYEEDQKCQAFVGPTGQLLSEVYMEPTGLYYLADIWYTNAVRCRPPANEDPRATQLKACRPYLLQDIEQLVAQYDRVVLLCVGAFAVKQLCGATLKTGFKTQGRLFTTESGKRVPCFFTYHPGALLPGRSPSSVKSVEDHLALLKRELEQPGSIAVRLPELSDIQVCPDPPQALSFLSLDIETYGIRSDFPEQRHFHPAKSMAPRSQGGDGIARSALVRTVGICWEQDGRDQVGIFMVCYPEHRHALGRWLWRLRSNNGTLLGMNILFDVSYLRAAHLLFLPHLLPADTLGTLQLQDLAVTSYLLNEIRPERSLKSLAALFLGLETYKGGEGRDLAFRRFESDGDPDLWLYNVRDAFATKWLHLYFLERIIEQYGSSTPKITEGSRRWYSDLLWMLLHMVEAGVNLDRPALELYAEEQSQILAKLDTRMRLAPAGGPVSGKGSQAYLRNLVLGLAQDHDPPDLEYTKKTKVVSTSKHNLNILLHHVPRTDPRWDLVDWLLQFRKAQKMLTSYLTPMLEGRRVGAGKNARLDTRSQLVEVENGLHRVYPTWYPVPSQFEGSDEDGGTNQGRVTCRSPALQTLPRSFKKYVVGRFRPGYLIWADLSQIELRVIAILSGDRHMIREYQQGVDRHSLTAQLVFGAHIVKHPQFRSVYRQVGKTCNFAIVFWCFPPALRHMFQQDVGLDIPLEQCEHFIRAYWTRYGGVREWHNRLLYSAKKKGHLELPRTGQSRLFQGSPRAVEETYLNNIVNFPVQCTAANILTDIQGELLRTFTQNRLRALMPLQVYDSVAVECPFVEKEPVLRALDVYMKGPPYYAELLERHQVDVPLTYDLEITHYGA